MMTWTYGTREELIDLVKTARAGVEAGIARAMKPYADEMTGDDTLERTEKLVVDLGFSLIWANWFVTLCDDTLEGLNRADTYPNLDPNGIARHLAHWHRQMALQAIERSRNGGYSHAMGRIREEAGATAHATMATMIERFDPPSSMSYPQRVKLT